MKRATTVSVWLSIASALVLFAVLLYLLIAGQGMGLKVSSLDGSGPQWPFTMAWLAGASALAFAAAAITIGFIHWVAQGARNHSLKSAYPPDGTRL